MSASAGSVTLLEGPVDTGTEELVVEVRGGVCHVQLSRPQRRNAFTPVMVEALADTLRAAEASDQVRAVVVSGAGASFCAGGDVKAFNERGGEGGGTAVPLDRRIDEQVDRQRDIVGRLRSMRKPTVAALTGAAAGAGLGIALACDLRVGSESTILATAFAKVGLSGDYGTTWLLADIAGASVARRLLLVEDRVDGREAMRLGLIDVLVEPDAVLGKALAMATRLVAGPHPAVEHVLANLRDVGALSLDAAMVSEVRRHMECGRSEHHREAVAAFVEKREPHYRDPRPHA